MNERTRMLRNRVCLSVLSILCAFGSVQPSPVLLPPLVLNPDNLPPFPMDHCNLTPKLGDSGSIKFVEDCEHLDTFSNLPMPSFQKYGTHPRVCCPRFSKKAVCFPTDVWCPSYVEPPIPTLSPQDLDHTLSPEDLENYEVETEPTIFVNEIVGKISDEDCSSYSRDFGYSTQCVNLKDCPGIFSPPSENLLSNVSLCGWDNEDKAIKICCPEAEIQDRSLRKVVEQRFPGYNCTDKVNQCQHWKNNDGCRTDIDFVIDHDDVDSGGVNSLTMFDFMTGTCMDTCGHCGDKGCRDEHPDCNDWARQGFCVTNPDLMVHTCRESCGVCGFLSTDEDEEQAVGENTYSDFRSSSFDCGRFKKLSDVGTEKKMEVEIPHIVDGEDEDYDIRSVNDEKNKETNTNENSEDETLDVFFSNEEGNKYCGATLISDKWIITASHCFDSIQSSSSIRINTIRDNTEFKETIEIKRIYKHPKYVYPQLYYDIALLELGRRVNYNWDKYGDTPMCIDRVGENEGKVATIQGYGLTENGTKGELLEGNVTVISNIQCDETFDYNITKADNANTIKQLLKTSLPEGLNEKLFCTQGEANEAGVVRGSCKGDSGGPLFVEGDNGRQMLVGIVSGGLGCGQGVPNWFTKVAFYVPWIECIIDNSKIYKNNKDKIEIKCNDVPEK